MFDFKCIPLIWACHLALPLVEWSGRMRMAKPWPNMCTKELQETMAQLEAIFHEMDRLLYFESRTHDTLGDEFCCPRASHPC